MSVRVKRGAIWKPRFTKQDIMDSFDRHGPVGGLVNSASYSMSWFIEKVFNNQYGKPLRLQHFQMVMFDMLWYKKFPMVLACRGAGKSFLLALYALVRCLLIPGTKVIIAGAGYRQAKLVFKYIDDLYKASPVIQEACRAGGGPKYGSDAATLKVGLSSITAIPIGDGEKIRGLRATVLIADEFGSIPEDTFEIVLSPFTSVHANPSQRAAIAHFVKRLKSMDAAPALIDAIQAAQDFGNQVVISGTATYRYNHFYKKYRSYRSFIESNGDKKELHRVLHEQQMEISAGKPAEITPEEVDRLARNYYQYAVYQLPYQGMPEDFLDDDTILRDKANFSSDRFMMEYEAKFPADSDGFIKRSRIDQATPIAARGEAPVEVELFGDPRGFYVMGLDPARQNDNFGMVILKLTDRGHELVFCDAWTKTDWATSAAKIREACRRFNIVYIAMDSGGGGLAVRDWLCKRFDGDGNEVEPEDLIWPIPDQLENPSDRAAPGRFMLDLVNFSTWTPPAAHNLEANIHQRRLLFPGPPNGVDEVVRQYQRFYQGDAPSPAIREELARELWGVDDWEVQANGGTKVVGAYDNVCECINETCAIVKEVTPTGVERFILPKLQNQPEGLDMRRRDRFSALLLANWAAGVYLGHGHRRHSVTPGDKSTARRKPIGGRRHKQRGSAAYFNPSGS